MESERKQNEMFLKNGKEDTEKRAERERERECCGRAKRVKFMNQTRNLA